MPDGLLGRVYLRWLPIHYFNRNAVANLLNIDLLWKVLGLLAVCSTAGLSRYIHCSRGLQERGWDTHILWYIVRQCTCCHIWIIFYCSAVTHNTRTHTNKKLWLVPALCCVTNPWDIRGAGSVDLYREHLLNQLGRSWRWQTSLQPREEVAPLSFEVEGETSFGIKNRISNSRPVLVCPPGPLCTHPQMCPTYWLVDAAGYVFRLSLCCVIEQDRLVRKACSGLLKGLWVTTWPDQTVTAEYHRLPLSEEEITETLTAACLCAACLPDRLFPTVKLPPPLSNVLMRSKQIPWKLAFNAESLEEDLTSEYHS